MEHRAHTEFRDRLIEEAKKMAAKSGKHHALLVDPTGSYAVGPYGPHLSKDKRVKIIVSPSGYTEPAHFCSSCGQIYNIVQCGC